MGRREARKEGEKELTHSPHFTGQQMVCYQYSIFSKSIYSFKQTCIQHLHQISDFIVTVGGTKPASVLSHKSPCNKWRKYVVYKLKQIYLKMA